MPDKKPDDKEQAEQKAEDAQAQADALAADAQKAEERAEDHGEPRAARCPECRARLDRYQGTNPHKVGSLRCPDHGRVSL